MKDKSRYATPRAPEGGILRVVSPLECRPTFNMRHHGIQPGANFRRVRAAKHDQYFAGGRRRTMGRAGVEERP